MAPTWVLALLISVSVSAFTVTGFIFQSRALRDPEEWKRYRRVGEIVLSPQWVIGFALQTFPNFFGDVIAYALAPLSLLAPLSGVAVALNTSLAPWMLGEKLHIFPDVPATGLILAGVVITSTSGCHQDHVAVTGSPMLLELLENRFTKTVFVGLGVSVAAAYFVHKMRRAFIEEQAKSTFDTPRLQFVLLAAWLAAAAGCITNIALKVLSELLTVPGEGTLATATLLLGILPAAVGQQQALNKGLRLYPQTVFFPVYSSLLMLANTLFGAVFFDEYTGLLHDGRGLVFALGLGCIVCGISLFSLRHSSQQESNESAALKERLLNTDVAVLPA